MVYFCADDYGISKESNSRIETCLKRGVLNKISVLPNGEITDFKKLSEDGANLSLHINLVEGHPLSDKEEVDLLVGEDGSFKYSFPGLLQMSLSGKRKEFEKQICKELKSQIRFWKESMGEDNVFLIDSHQHTHMIPLIFKNLMRVIKDEGVNVGYLRIPSEPVTPYVFTPSLFASYSLKGLAKQWILKILAFINRKEFEKMKIRSAYFMGMMFSGELSEARVKKILPRYIKLAEKKGMDVEIGFHPGYMEEGETPISGYKKSFEKFYFSNWRKAEYDTLLNFRL